MTKKITSLLERKVSSVKFISASANDVQYQKENYVGQVAYVFPKAGKTTVYISLLTAELFLLTTHNGRMSHTLKISNDIKEISEAALVAYEVACESARIDIKLAKKQMLKAC